MGNPYFWRTRSSLVLALVAILGACGPSNSPSNPPPTPATLDPVRSTVTVDRSSAVAADGQDRVTVTVSLVDTNGAALADREVELAVSGQVNQVVHPVRTDADGRTTGTFVSTAAETKTVTASVESVTLAQTPTVQFVPAPAVRLRFSTAPAAAIAGAPFDPAVAVLVEDALGRPVQASHPVTLSLSGGADSAALVGNASAASTDGIAQFPGLLIEVAARGYVLQASAPGLDSVTSAPFDVAPAAADRLSFVRQPMNGVAGEPLSPVEVHVLDAFDNPVDSPVSVSVAVDPATAGLAGETSLGAVNGTATFEDSMIARAGSSYRLAASADGLTAAVRDAFSIASAAPDPAKPTLIANPSTLQVGGTARLTITVVDAFGNPVSGQTVSFMSSAPKDTLVTIGRINAP